MVTRWRPAAFVGHVSKGASMTMSAIDPGPDRWDVPSPITTDVRLRLHGRARPAAPPLRQGHPPAVDRRATGSTGRVDVDPDNPLGMPDEIIPLVRHAVVGQDERPTSKGEVRRHLEAWQFSQFMHGEQGALICTAKIVQTVPDIDSKFYAATQVIDEARHVEVYSRYLHEKLELVYPLNPQPASRCSTTSIADSRWDMTYLGMQVLIEGLALAAFGLIRNKATDPLGKAINAYVMQDEARHVMFGRLALRDYYPQLTAGRARRARGVLRRRLLPDARPLPRRGGLGSARPARTRSPTYVEHSELHARRSAASCSRASCRSCKDIGLWGRRSRRRSPTWACSQFADADIDAEMANDDRSPTSSTSAWPTSRSGGRRLTRVGLPQIGAPSPCGRSPPGWRKPSTSGRA